MKTVKIPSFLHDILGERQFAFEIILITLFGVGASAFIIYLHYHSIRLDQIWKSLLGYLLLIDIAAGCLANMTRGTNDYYGKRPANRIIFISIHFHLILCAWLLGAPILPAILIWLYTICVAFLINGLKKNPHQKIIAFILLLFGISALFAVPDVMPLWFRLISLLFLTKVSYSFAVDHFGSEEE